MRKKSLGKNVNNVSADSLFGKELRKEEDSTKEFALWEFLIPCTNFLLDIY